MAGATLQVAEVRSQKSEVRMSVMHGLSWHQKADHLDQMVSFFYTVPSVRPALTPLRTRLPISITMAVRATGTANSPNITLCK